VKTKQSPHIQAVYNYCIQMSQYNSFLFSKS